MHLVRKGLLLVCCLAAFAASAQTGSRLRISLLTCSPGQELYSVFGHTAIRITDSTAGSDIVYNYGTFNFDDPDFYLKFVRGKLLYSLSSEYFQDFRYAYQQEGRGITEQLLHLDSAEQRSLQLALEKNLQPANKDYKYDFFFDNCTTRARDMILQHRRTAMLFKPVMPPGTTFREGIHMYLDRGGNCWSKLGIDILLGAPTDAVMDTGTMQFLPDNLMIAFDSCITAVPLVAIKSSLYQYSQERVVLRNYMPALTCWLVLAFFVVLAQLKAKPAAGLLRILDVLLFFATGLLGVILVFMWTGTDHAMCRSNYNLLWAWPTHLVMAFFLFSRRKRAKTYFNICTVAMLLLLLVWFILQQQMNNALIPVVLLLLYRSSAVYRSALKRGNEA